MFGRSHVKSATNFFTSSPLSSFNLAEMEENKCQVLQGQGEPTQDSATDLSSTNKQVAELFKHPQGRLADPSNRAQDEASRPHPTRSDHWSQAEQYAKRLEQETKRLQCECEGLRSENKSLKVEADQLKARYQATQNEFEQCKAELFKLQPPNKATDVDIEDGFKELSHNVADYVSEAFTVLDEIDESRLVATGSALSASRPAKLEPRAMNASMKYPSASEYFMHYAIFTYLSALILRDSKFLVGMERGDHDLCSEVQAGMKSIWPDSETQQSRFENWLAETLTAMDKAPKYIETKRERLQHLTESLQGKLIFHFPMLGAANFCTQSLSQNIILPAVNLANLMRKTGPGRYKLSLKPEKYLFGDGRPVFAQALRDCVIKDVSTRKTLSGSTCKTGNEDEVLGVLVAVIEPGLMRSGNSDRALRKAVIVIDTRGTTGNQPRE